MRGTTVSHEITPPAPSTNNVAHFVGLFVEITPIAEGIFRKEGIVPGSTIFVGLAVAYDLGWFLGFHGSGFFRLLVWNFWGCAVGFGLPRRSYAGARVVRGVRFGVVCRAR